MRIINIILAVAAVAGLIVWGTGILDESDQVKFARQNPSTIKELIDPAIAQEVPNGYITAMLELRAGEVPEVDDLKTLGPWLSQRLQTHPLPDGSYGRRYTLLDHALIYRNIDGVKALLEAGADPNQSSTEFGRAAFTDPSGRPDWSTSPQFLKLYLGYGGNVDYGRPDDPEPMVTIAASNGNFKGAKFLVENGANLWIEIRGTSAQRLPDRYLYPLLRVGGGRPDSMDFLRWVQSEGYLNNAPQPIIEAFYDRELQPIDAIVAGETMLDLETISIIGQLLEQSSTVPTDYRADDRAKAAARIATYVTEKNNRP